MKTIGVIIARFQSPYLHEGHIRLIDSVRSNHDSIVIVMGVSPVKGSRKNPLDYHTREKMIKTTYPEVVVLPLSDHPMDSKWSQNLDELLNNTFPGSGFRLYGSRDSFIPHYTGNFSVEELPETKGFSSTLIREQISNKVLDSPEFRTGIIYGYSNTYTKVFPTVDIAVFRSGKTELLLGSKTIDNKWRLLGGFADPEDASFEAAARRELTEECGPIGITPLQYEASFKVDDWRYRPEADKIITILFSGDITEGTPKGNDDIAEVRWFKLGELKTMVNDKMIAKEHFPHIDILLKRYFK